jgi:protein-S-isoprenylcysteine O-methyltransferase Ste14
VTPQTIALAVLVFALIVTRLWEEGRWRDGKMSDRTAAILVVARLPFLVFGFLLLVGQPWPVVAGGTVVAGLVAAGLYRVVVARLRRLANGPGSTVKRRS